MKRINLTRKHYPDLSSIAAKAVSAALAVSMCASVASCDINPTETSPSTETETTATTTETSETTTVTTTTEATTTETEPEVTGPDFSVEHTYRIFNDSSNSMLISMNIDIDEYIKTEGDKQYFELYRLLSDLGWREKGQYTYEDYVAAKEADPKQTKIGHSNWFEYKYGDHRAVFTISEYVEDIKSFKSRQVSWIVFEYQKNDFAMPYFNDTKTNNAHKKVDLCFKKHYKKLEYYIDDRCVCSKDDALIIAYGIWIFTSNPDDNSKLREPFEKFRTNKGVQLP